MSVHRLIPKEMVLWIQAREPYNRADRIFSMEDRSLLLNRNFIPPFVNALAAALLGFGATNAHASPIFNVHLSGSGQCNDGGQSSSTPLTQSLAGCVSGLGSIIFTNTMSASADYLSLRAYVDLGVQIPDLTSLQGGGIGAIAGWSDNVIVTGGAGAGFLRLSYTLSGTVVQGFGAAYLQLNGNGTQIFFDQGTFTMDVPFVFGVPVNIGASLQVSAFPSDLFAVGGPASLRSIVDYTNTAAQLPFSVLDNNLQLVAGASVSSSDSSFSYPVNDPGSAVPEPSAMVLLLIASPFIAFARRVSM